MHLAFYVTLASLIFGSFILGCLCVFTWRRRSANSSVALSLFLGAAALWVVAAAAEHLAPTLAGKVLASKIQYLGILTVPIASLCTVLAYLGLDKWQRPFLTFAIPGGLLCFALVASNNIHHWVWRHRKVTALRYVKPKWNI